MHAPSPSKPCTPSGERYRIPSFGLRKILPRWAASNRSRVGCGFHQNPAAEENQITADSLPEARFQNERHRENNCQSAGVSRDGACVSGRRNLGVLCRKPIYRAGNGLEVFGSRNDSERLFWCGSVVCGKRLDDHLRGAAHRFAHAVGCSGRLFAKRDY